MIIADVTLFYDIEFLLLEPWRESKTALKCIVPQRTLYDVRGADGTGTSSNPVTSGSNAKTYTIRKLADGNCWMSESLYLPLSVGTGIEMSYNNGAIDTYSPTADAYIGTETRQGPSGYTDYYYYNWNSATAEKGNSSSTGDVDGSICPKGWKLPYDYEINPSISWRTLANAYGITSTTTSTGYLTLSSSPISLPLVGIWSVNNFYYGGGGGYYWSSTAAGATYAHSITFSASNVYWGLEQGKARNGMGIRCVVSPLAH